jgi:ankyrin repeat protein
MNVLSLMRCLFVWACLGLIWNSPLAAAGSSTDDLQVAIDRHDAATLKKLLAQGADPNKVNEMGDSLLHSAVLAVDVTAVTLLLERGARLEQPNSIGFTPLATACDRLDFKTSSATGPAAFRIVRLLLDRGANPNAAAPAEKESDPGAATPFLNAVGNVNASQELIKLLVAKGANVNQPFKIHPESSFTGMNGYTPLMIAISRAASREVVEFLIEQGADVHARSTNGDTAIKRAFTLNLDDIQLLLQSKGAKLTAEEKKSVVRKSYEIFADTMKRYLLFAHTALTKEVANDPLLVTAPMKQLLEKANLSDGFDEFDILSASCTQDGCEVVMKHKFLRPEYCSPLDDIKACAGRISGPAGKGTISVSELYVAGK